MSFLRPRDLLTLPRTSKDFRAYLTSRRSIPCWKAARQRWEDLPDCPSDISEMHYARLVFTEECHVRSVVPTTSIIGLSLPQSPELRAARGHVDLEAPSARVLTMRERPVWVSFRVFAAVLTFKVCRLVKARHVNALIKKVQKASERSDPVLLNESLHVYATCILQTASFLRASPPEPRRGSTTYST